MVTGYQQQAWARALEPQELLLVLQALELLLVLALVQQSARARASVPRPARPALAQELRASELQPALALVPQPGPELLLLQPVGSRPQ